VGETSAQFTDTLKAPSLGVVGSHEERAKHTCSVAFSIVATYGD
jgi:hypothetical protein